jgi:CubicO group peptidase (beta-lactamase class C family)
VALASAAAAQAPGGDSRLERALDRIFAEWDRSDGPGCAVGVARQGRLVAARGYGLASLEHAVPITPDTVFYAGSISKQFTAAAIAMLAREGRLGLDDDLRRHVPELPAYEAPITIRHLVHHTSGLRDYSTLLALAGRRGDEAFDNRAVLQIAARQQALNFAPGDEFLYSNTGYALLAIVVERASGMRFSEYVERVFFQPLGMHQSHFHDDLRRLVPNRAFGYSLRPGGGWDLDAPYNERVGAGGLFTTVGDLLKWDAGVREGTVGGRALADQLEKPGRLNNGRRLLYAFGLRLGENRGLRIVEHGGSLGGYRAHLTRFPDDGVSVACLCNFGTAAPGALVRRVADVALQGRFPHRAGSRAAAARLSRRASEDGPVPAGDGALAGYAGAYTCPELDAAYTVVLRDSGLYLRVGEDQREAPLVLTNADEFGGRGLVLRFTRDEAGEVDGFRVGAGRVRDVRCVRVP